MAYAFIAQTGFANGSGGGTSSAIDTTGANLIVIVAARLEGSAPTISDSASNTWSALTVRNSGNSAAVRIYYVFAPTTSATHTFTSSGANTYGSLSILAFSGSVTSPFDAENGAGATTGTSRATGSVTPAEDNELFIAGIAFGVEVTGLAIDSTFIGLNHYIAGGTSIDVGSAYKIQTTGGAENPTFSWTTSSDNAAAIACFKAGAAGRTTKNTRGFTLGTEIGMNWRSGL